MKEFPEKADVVIIGSGITGLALAQHLKEKRIVNIVADKGRYPGGRMAAREVGKSGLINTGPSFFITHQSVYCEKIEQVCRQSQISNKPIQTLSERQKQGLSGYLDSFEIFEPNASFRTFSTALAEDLNPFQSYDLREITQGLDGWKLRFQKTSQEALIELHADKVVLTMPPPQIAELLARSSLNYLLPDDFDSRFSYERSLVGLFEVKKREAVENGIALLPANHPMFRRLQQRSYLSSDNTIIYVESTDAFARQYWDEPREWVLEQFRSKIEEIWPGIRIIVSDFHRWKYGRLKPESCGFTSPLKLSGQPLLILAGEGFGITPEFPAGLISAQHSAKLASAILTSESK